MTFSRGKACDYADLTEYCLAAPQFAIRTRDWGWSHYCIRHHIRMTCSAITALETVVLTTD